MKRPPAVSLVLILCCCPIAAPSAESVVAKLTPEEFKAAGLHKLSAPEIAALDAALQRQTAVAPPKKPEPAREALFGAETLPASKTAAAPSSIRTRIVGRFEGWTGKTLFVLENGQRWQQRIPDTYVAPRPLESPEVVLERGSFGYRLVIPEFRHQVPVKRIQ